MRVGERLLTLLFQYPLKRCYRDAHARITAAAGALRKVTKWEGFKVRYVKKEPNKIAPFGMSRQKAKTIMKYVKDDVMPLLVGETDPHRDHFSLLFHHYVCAIAIMRKVPSVKKGDPLYAAGLLEDAAELQQHLDAACAAALRIEGDTVLSNYFIWLRSGYYKYWMEKLMLYPYCWSNDGAERTNEDAQVWFFKHSPRGGGRKTEEDRSFAESLCDFALMKLSFFIGEADEFFDVKYSDEAVTSRRRRSHLADPKWRLDHGVTGGRGPDHAAAAQTAAAKRVRGVGVVARAQGRALSLGGAIQRKRRQPPDPEPEVENGMED